MRSRVNCEREETSARLVHAVSSTLLGGALLVFGFAMGACGSDAGSTFRGEGLARDEATSGGDGADSSGGLSLEEPSSGKGQDSCAELDEAADLVPANLLFVVDKSGSMNCNPPPIDATCAEPIKVDEQASSKWEVTRQALTGSQGALQTLAGQVGISAGLIAFPTDAACAVPDEGELSVPMRPLSAEHLQALEAGLSPSPDGKTPLAGAAIRGLEALRRGIDSGQLRGDNYLVVMTDGEDTCQPAALEDLKTFVAQAQASYGIRTYAIGAPGSEGSRALLSELAALGGTARSSDCETQPETAKQACHVDLTGSVDFAADLGAVFADITAETAGTCEYEVPPSALVDRDKVNVEYTPGDGEPALIVQDSGSGVEPCEGAEGWQYSNDGSQILLCGEFCEQVLRDPGGRVQVVFGCRDTVVK